MPGCNENRRSASSPDRESQAPGRISSPSRLVGRSRFSGITQPEPAGPTLPLLGSLPPTSPCDPAVTRSAGSRPNRCQGVDAAVSPSYILYSSRSAHISLHWAPVSYGTSLSWPHLNFLRLGLDAWRNRRGFDPSFESASPQSLMRFQEEREGSDSELWRLTSRASDSDVAIPR